MRKIDAVIVGAQKAGTTSLNTYLAEHPDILGHPQTEFAYFRDDNEYQQDYDQVFDRYFTLGDSTSSIVLAKNAAIYDSEKAIKRLADHNPDCKIIFLLRNPVSRAISSYHMERFNGWMKHELDEIVGVIEREEYESVLYRLLINMGLYADHLQVLQEHFPKENIKLYLFEELKQDTASVYRDICHWLGVSDSFLPDLEAKHNPTYEARNEMLSNLIFRLRSEKNPVKRFVKTILPYSTFTKLGNLLVDSNRSDKKPKPASTELKEYLHDYFRPFNDRLREMTDLDIDIWNKPAG